MNSTASASSRSGYSHFLSGCGFAALLLVTPVLASPGQAGESCLATLAATHNFSLGAPRVISPAADGQSVFYLRSGPRDTAMGLYRLDLASGQEHALALPAGQENLSVEEKARRERARQVMTGITDYTLSRDSKKIMIAQADKLSVIDSATGKIADVPGTGWIGPQLSPDGSAIAAVRADDVHVVTLATGRDAQLTHGGTDVVTNGLAEFAAAEELDRADGIWWSPDSQRLIYEHADSSKVEQHYIADPQHPELPPNNFRYPRAGTDNAEVTLFITSRKGGKSIPISWDREALPYVADVNWPKTGKLTLTLFSRDEKTKVLMAVDPETGRTTKLITETDPAWVNLNANLGIRGPNSFPVWLDKGSSFLWATEKSAGWQLELRHADGSLDHPVTPASLPFLGLSDVDEATGTVTVTANPSRIDVGVYRVKLAGGDTVTPVFQDPGVYMVGSNPDATRKVLIEHFNDASGAVGAVVLDESGKKLADIPSVAEKPRFSPNLHFTTAGVDKLDAVVITPQHFDPQKKYPVILSVYAGPTVKMVQRAPRAYLEDQCLADEGFIVASVDGRGTPGRDHDFERAIKDDLIDAPLHDQVDGLQDLGHQFGQMDMQRVGVTGWSFGGYFTAMATIRRPDVFKAGVAGAPVVDFADYDTAYTERYLGTPQDSPKAYAVSSVLTYAKDLSRPLMLIHGLTDDNVYFENTVKLTQALLRAGKDYSLLLLPGTHMLADPVLRQHVDDARLRFFETNLK